MENSATQENQEVTILTAGFPGRVSRVVQHPNCEKSSILTKFCVEFLRAINFQIHVFKDFASENDTQFFRVFQYSAMLDESEFKT